MINSKLAFWIIILIGFMAAKSLMAKTDLTFIQITQNDFSDLEKTIADINLSGGLVVHIFPPNAVLAIIPNPQALKARFCLDPLSR